MNKATIVEDAITYIEPRQNIMQSLSYELHEMEATSKEIKPKKEEIKNCIHSERFTPSSATMVEKTKGSRCLPRLWTVTKLPRRWMAKKKQKREEEAPRHLPPNHDNNGSNGLGGSLGRRRRKRRMKKMQKLEEEAEE
ncbi:hypothetical protein HKD37_18G051569 [Glycine soja]